MFGLLKITINTGIFIILAWLYWYTKKLTYIFRLWNEQPRLGNTISILLFVLASTTRMKRWESKGDIWTGLFMCYFTKLNEFTTKPHRKANSPHVKPFTTETEIKVKWTDAAKLDVNNFRDQLADKWIRQHVLSLLFVSNSVLCEEE